MAGAGRAAATGRYTSAASSTPSRMGMPTSKTGVGSAAARATRSSKRWRGVLLGVLVIHPPPPALLYHCNVPPKSGVVHGSSITNHSSVGQLERVGQPIAQQAEGQAREHHGDTREGADPPLGVDEGAALVDHVAPIRRGWLCAESEEVQGGD